LDTRTQDVGRRV